MTDNPDVNFKDPMARPAHGQGHGGIVVPSTEAQIARLRFDVDDIRRRIGQKARVVEDPNIVAAIGLYFEDPITIPNGVETKLPLDDASTYYAYGTGFTIDNDWLMYSRNAVIVANLRVGWVGDTNGNRVNNFACGSSSALENFLPAIAGQDAHNCSSHYSGFYSQGQTIGGSVTQDSGGDLDLIAGHPTFFQSGGADLPSGFATFLSVIVLEELGGAPGSEL